MRGSQREGRARKRGESTSNQACQRPAAGLSSSATNARLRASGQGSALQPQGPCMWMERRGKLHMALVALKPSVLGQHSYRQV